MGSTTREEQRWETEGGSVLPLTSDDPPFPGPVAVPIEDALDLHPFAPRDVPAVVADYVEAAAAAGLVEVRLIHGRGQGVQRRRVREVLGGHPLVVELREATPDRGGSGATIVRLRPAAGSR